MTATAHSHGLENEFGFIPEFTFRGARVASGKLAETLEAASPLELDHDALNIFLRSDMFLNGGTPFRGVRRFSPPPAIMAEQERSRQEAIDGYIELFRQAIARRAMHESIVALSGGRDSRHILFELHAQGRMPVAALTVALEMNSDLEIAKQVASAVGVKHLIERPNRTIEGAQYTVRATDFMSMQHGWMADVARRRGPEAWWDGIAGDVLSAGHFLEEWNIRLFAERRLDELAERLVRPGRVPYFRDQSLFPRGVALEAMRNELARHVDAANPVGSFYFWNRTRVNIAASTFGLLRPTGQITLAPFLDRDLWPFLASLPLRLVQDYKLHEDVIHIMYPKFASIGYSSKHSVGRAVHRRHALTGMRSMASGRPSRAGVGAIARLLRSIIKPSRASDVDWVISTWVYGKMVEEIAGL